jgi:predicted flap endonuclease-1-like 5' DNA nuclease
VVSSITVATTLPPPIAEAPTPATAPAPLADEPIAAAAPLEASPASIAADLAAPAPEPIAEEAPAPQLQPEIPVAAEAGADVLTRMKGVGPRVAERLNALGITSFSQVAALTPAEADALDAQLDNFKGRLHRDRWIEQAGFLARGDTAGYEAVFGKL